MINPIVLSIPVFFLLIGIELLVAKWTSKPYYRLSDALTNLGCGITQQVSNVFLKVFSVGLYALVYEHFRAGEIASTPVSFAALFVLTDLAYYWAHRMSHEINLFWSAHVVHHQSEDYNLSVALRQSALQVVWTSFFYLPLAVMGFRPVDFVLAAAFTTLYQFWVHTQAIGKLGVLEYILVTPSLHRVHHGRDPKYIDKNHGGVFIWWDMLFGTYQREEEPPTYGITRPVNSWNPVWANVSHLAWMWHEMKQIPGWADKLRYLFYKPGWLPATLGGYRPAPAVDKARYRKYDPPVSRPLAVYVMAQFVVLVGLASWFMFVHEQMALWPKLGLALLIGLASVTVGGLLEHRRWAKAAEAVKLLASIAAAVYMHLYAGLPAAVIYGAVLWAVVSLLYVYKKL